ncbi:MAG: CPBP family intramembrane glutamic endopeptidase [Rhizomicrobium sp.]
MNAENPLATAQGAKARGIALLRFVIFVVIALALGVALVLGARKIFGPINIDQTAGLKFLIPGEFALAVATVIVPSAIMVLITREPAIRFGFGGAHRFRQMLFGILTGLGAMSVLIALMAAFGGVQRWTFAPLNATAAWNFAGYIVMFALVAVSEEGLLRGYGLVQLSRAISFWPAAIVTSVIFILLHLGHKTESLVGLAQVGVIGMILAYSFRRTGALWFALGCHGAWDFAETYIYGVPDSGMTAPGALSHVVLRGPAWLTGGVTGPEASWLAFVALAAMAAVVCFALPRTAEE